MRKWHIECDVEVRKFDDLTEVEIPQPELLRVDRALSVELGDLEAMDFDLDIRVTNIDVEMVTE